MNRWWWKKTNPVVVTDQPEPDQPVIVGAGDGKGELNIYSPTWVFLKQHLESEVQRLRERNDSVALTAEQTAVIRGEIRALSRLAKLPEEMKRKSGLMNTPEPE